MLAINSNISAFEVEAPFNHLANVGVLEVCNAGGDARILLRGNSRSGAGQRGSRSRPLAE